MGRGSADEAVVIVKAGACDPMVTSVRIKHQASAREAEVKGGTRKRFWSFITDRGSEISPKKGLLTTGQDVHIGCIDGSRSLKEPCKDESEMKQRNLLTEVQP